MARDRLLLQGLRLFGRHGVLPAERTLGQDFVVSVSVDVDARKAGATDDPADSDDYVRVFDAAKHVVEGPPRLLVEAVATDIARRVFRDVRGAEAVSVRVTKPQVALPATLEAVGVEIFRERADFAQELEEAAAREKRDGSGSSGDNGTGKR